VTASSSAAAKCLRQVDAEDWRDADDYLFDGDFLLIGEDGANLSLEFVQRGEEASTKIPRFTTCHGRSRAISQANTMLRNSWL
jgi:hypothetical protein